MSVPDTHEFVIFLVFGVCHPEQVTRRAATRQRQEKTARRPPHSEHLTNAAVFSLGAEAAGVEGSTRSDFPLAVRPSST